tara:strand:- start:8099 stop:8749 length:651 start_codon:yes stop_codon:yes gene_type:complete
MDPISMGVSALGSIAGGMIGSGKRKREQRQAQQEFSRNKARYEGLDTSNQYTNLENTYEDLTVNTQAADFAAQKQQQVLANTMSGMQGAAGGGGIAAMAQAMAGQQSANMQAASADIARQESSNQAAQAQMAGNLQMAERMGAEKSRAAEIDKTETMLGMSQARLGAANAARDAATNSIIGGVTGLASAALPAIPGLGELGTDGSSSFMSNLMGKK